MRHAYGYESDNCLVAHVCHSGMVGLYRCLREVVAQSADHWQAGYLLTHSRNSLAKPMLAYSEQYTGILSLLKKPPGHNLHQSAHNYALPSRGVQYVHCVMHKCIMVKVGGKNTRKVCKNTFILRNQGGNLSKVGEKEKLSEIEGKMN